MKKLFYNVLAFIRMLKAEVKNMKKEQDLDALIQPIRKWLSENPKRNALVILSEPRAKTHLVLATNTTGEDMVPDMGMIVGMEPQLTDVLSLIVGEAMEVKPMQEPEADWEDTIDFTASCGDVPQSDTPADADPISNHCRTIPETLSRDK